MHFNRLEITLKHATHSGMFEHVLILLSFLFGILCIRHIRSFDVHEQEPFGAMLAVVIWGGIASVGISLFLYRMLTANSISVHDGFPFNFLYVGLTEELAKLLALLLCWPIIRREMNEPTDGPIYMACVALGFSLIENFFYASAHPDITFLIGLRLILCTPMHIAFSLFMGLAFFWAVRVKGGWGFLIASYLFAGIYHALYDIFVNIPYLIPALYFVLKGAYQWMYRLLGYTAARSPFRQSLADFIHKGPPPHSEAGFNCIECKDPTPKPTYRKGRIRIQRCETCGTYLCSVSTLRQLVHHYGSIFGSLKRRTKRLYGQGRGMRVLLGANRIDTRQRTACFQLDEFNAVLEKSSRELAERLEKKWWFPFRAEQES